MGCVDRWLCGRSAGVQRDSGCPFTVDEDRGARDLREATQSAARALRETGRRDDEEAGVKTNEGVVAHADWEGGKCDTTRLQRERELGDVINTGTEALKPRMGVLGLQKQQDAEAVVVTATLV